MLDPHQLRFLPSAFDELPADLDKQTFLKIAAEDLRRIAALYKVEAGTRGCGPEQRLNARQALTAPRVASFGDWLQASPPARIRKIPPLREAGAHPTPRGRASYLPL